MALVYTKILSALLSETHRSWHIVLVSTFYRNLSFVGILLILIDPHESILLFFFFFFRIQIMHSTPYLLQKNFHHRSCHTPSIILVVCCLSTLVVRYNIFLPASYCCFDGMFCHCTEDALALLKVLTTAL